MSNTLNKAKISGSVMWGASLSLTAFWIANILKEAYPPVKSFLGFNKAVGPLLGLYILGVLVFGLITVLWYKSKLSNLSDRTNFIIYVLATILFFLMVFPPVFEPIVKTLAK